MMELDVVDISSWVSGGSSYARERTAAKLDAQLAEHSFVLVGGHGIPGSVESGLEEAIRDFFEQPLEFKLLTSALSDSRGYRATQSEMMCRSLGIESPTGRFDAFEAFDMGSSAKDYPHVRAEAALYSPNVWPELPDFRRRVELYFDEIGRVARTALRALGTGLGLTETAFDPITDHSADLLRLNRYAIPPDAAPDSVGMSAHEDFGLLSLAWCDGVAGLHLAGPDARWHEVTAPAGTLVLMVGEALARFTAERWQPTLHRVMPAPGAVRHSAVYFHEGNAEAVVGPHPRLTEAASGTLPPPIRIDEHIAAKSAAVRRGGRAFWDEAALARLPREERALPVTIRRNTL